MCKTLKLYYWNYDDEGIDSESPQEKSLDDGLKCMENLPDSDGNFLGFELSNDEIIQFIYDDKRGLIVDIPDKEKDGSYIKIVDLSEALQIIRNIYNGKKNHEIEGLFFEAFS